MCDFWKTPTKISKFDVRVANMDVSDLPRRQINFISQSLKMKSAINCHREQPF